MFDSSTDKSDRVFRLSAQEKFLFGVKLKGDALWFGPPGSALVLAVLTSVIAVVLAVVFVVADVTFTFVFWEVTPVVGRVFTIGVALAVLAHLFALLRSGTRITPETVETRSVFRRQRVAWGSIAGTRIIEDRPGSPFDLVLGEGGSLRADVDSTKAYLLCTNGSLIRLRGFESAAQESTAASVSATPTQLKVDALRRYRDEMVGPWPATRKHEG